MRDNLQHRVDNLSFLGETELIEAARTDSDAFAELYRRYLRRVFHYLLTFAETVEDAGDLTQLVFLRAFEALPGYRERGLPFSAWLMRIARNLATDAYRRRRKTLPWTISHLPGARSMMTLQKPTRYGERRSTSFAFWSPSWSQTAGRPHGALYGPISVSRVSDVRPLARPLHEQIRLVPLR